MRVIDVFAPGVARERMGNRARGGGCNNVNNSLSLFISLWSTVMIFSQADRFYSDGPLPQDHPLHAEAERAYRQAFLSAACTACQWLRPDRFELDLALRQRQRARKHAEIQRTEPISYKSGHEVLAAQTRGRHHALDTARQAWELPHANRRDLHALLDRWLMAVRQWACAPADAVTAPPCPAEMWQHQTSVSHESGVAD